MDQHGTVGAASSKHEKAARAGDRGYVVDWWSNGPSGSKPLLRFYPKYIHGSCGSDIFSEGCMRPACANPSLVRVFGSPDACSETAKATFSGSVSINFQDDFRQLGNFSINFVFAAYRTISHTKYEYVRLACVHTTDLVAKRPLWKGVLICHAQAPPMLQGQTLSNIHILILGHALASLTFNTSRLDWQLICGQCVQWRLWVVMC